MPEVFQFSEAFGIIRTFRSGLRAKIKFHSHLARAWVRNPDGRRSCLWSTTVLVSSYALFEWKEKPASGTTLINWVPLPSGFRWLCPASYASSKLGSHQWSVSQWLRPIWNWRLREDGLLLQTPKKKKNQPGLGHSSPFTKSWNHPWNLCFHLGGVVVLLLGSRDIRMLSRLLLHIYLVYGASLVGKCTSFHYFQGAHWFCLSSRAVWVHDLYSG